MKKIMIVWVLLYSSIFADVYNIDTLGNILGKNTHKTVIIDPSINKKFKIITSKVEPVSAEDIKYVLSKNNLKLIEDDNYIYIKSLENKKKKNDKNFMGKKNKNEDVVSVRIINTNLSQGMVQDICDQLNFKCLKVKNNYLITSEKYIDDDVLRIFTPRFIKKQVYIVKVYGFVDSYEQLMKNHDKLTVIYMGKLQNVNVVNNKYRLNIKITDRYNINFSNNSVNIKIDHPISEGNLFQSVYVDNITYILLISDDLDIF